MTNGRSRALADMSGGACAEDVRPNAATRPNPNPSNICIKFRQYIFLPLAFLTSVASTSCSDPTALPQQHPSMMYAQNMNSPPALLLLLTKLQIVTLSGAMHLQMWTLDRLPRRHRPRGDATVRVVAAGGMG